MTVNSGTRLNGGSVDSNPAPVVLAPLESSSAPRFARFWIFLLIGAATLFCAFLMDALPVPLIWESVRLALVGIVILFLIVYARLAADVQKAVFFLWGLVLLTERIFFRQGDMGANAAAFEGRFPAAVYSEVLCWVFYLIAALVFLLPAHRLNQLFSGNHKWLTWFAIVCTVSCFYAPRTAFALAWAFKLSVVVLVLLLCSTQIRDVKGAVRFLKFTFWAYALIMLVPVVLGCISGTPFDEEGRMSTIVNPDALSADAAAVSVLALTLYSRLKDEGLGFSAIVVGTGAYVVAVLAGGKAGIAGGLFGGVLFLMLRRRLGSAFGYVGGAFLVAFVLALFTPLGSYLSQYRESGQATTLTGRTLLWKAVMPAILHRPILGHGYLSSTFVEMQVNAVNWAAPQLHNGFVEVLYNNGLIGLVLIVAINFVIARSLIIVLLRNPLASVTYRIGAGCIALYAHLFLNGLFNASFGGRARPPFILLLSLLMISSKLLALTPELSGAVLADTATRESSGTGTAALWR
jgi:O-antigen ligase